MRKTRKHVASLVFVLVLVGGLVGTTLALELEPSLGLDLRGGLSVTLTAPEGTDPAVLEKTIEVLQQRVDRAGVAEPEIASEGRNNVLIQLPGVDEPARLLDLIGRTAQLQFRQVQAEIPGNDPAFASATVSADQEPAAEVVYVSKDGSVKYRLGPAELTGEGVRRASARPSDTGAAWEVLADFTREGSRKWEEFTGRLACLQGPTRQIAIALDGVVESAPQVDTEVQCNAGITGGTTTITGNFNEETARDLALVLNTGALPVKLEQSEVRNVSATLGEQALRAGLLAGILGLALVMTYVLLYYRTLGLQTWLGLLVFSALIYGLTLVFGATINWNLTLAGIAGLIVSVGIAADSYIVFFERVKEELHQGRSLASSIDKGFGHAWRTMRAANMVTILAAIALYFLAVGSVRGFALALGVATLLDLAVTYFMTWPVAALLARNKFFAENRVIGMKRALEGSEEKPGKRSILRKIYRSEFKIDFIGRRRLWFSISAVMVAISAVALIPGVRGLTYGIDFRGGSVYRAPVENNVTVDEVRTAARGVGQGDAVVQIIEDRVNRTRQVQIQTDESTPKEREELVAALAKVTGNDSAAINVDQVGQKWGAQVTQKALRGLVIFLIAVIIYMTARLELKMAAAGIAALLHDLVLTIGIYAIVGFEVTPATVVATLTILGFSLYDTVVVFDKIRENQALPGNARKSFARIANESTNQVLMRSINTSLTVLIPVGSLLFVGSFLLGADTLKDLSLALFVGVAASTFSSIFVATPLLSVWKERERRYAGLREKPLTEAEPQMSMPMNGAEEEAEPSRPMGAAGSTLARAQTRRKQTRAQRKKTKR